MASLFSTDGVVMQFYFFCLKKTASSVILDSEKVCKKVSENLGIDEYYSNLLPEDKMAVLEELIKKGQTMFVGDGINDTLSISLADVSVSMGIRGSDSTIEYSDIVIENDNLENIDTAFKFAKKTRKIILENLIKTV